MLDPGIPVQKKWRLREGVEEKFHGVLAFRFKMDQIGLTYHENG